MKELIKIHDTKTGRVVSARDLHTLLENKRRFSDWIKQRIAQYGFVENQDYTSFHKSVKREVGSSVRQEYAITIDMGKELCMIENNSQGKKARRYFIEMEKLARQHQISLPTRMELAQMVIDAEKEILELNNKIEAARPLVRYAEAVQKVDDNILLRQLAKHISNQGHVRVGQNKLFQWMRDKGYLNKKNEPYQDYINMGLFGYHETNVKNAKASFTRRTTTVTGKGRVYFVDKYLKQFGIATLALT